MVLRISKAASVLALVWCLAMFGVASRGSAYGGTTPAGKLKVYISVDMEGVAGTVTADQSRRPVSTIAAETLAVFANPRLKLL